MGNSYYYQSGQEPVFSADGSKVLFASYASNLVAGDANNTWDYFAKDVNTGVVTYSYTQSNSILSPDGTKMLFMSYEINLVAGDTNNTQDVFVRDLTTGSVTLVSGTADAMVKKRAELAVMNLVAQPLTNPDLEPGFSLGGFDTQAAAAAELSRLTSQRGIRTAKVVRERAQGDQNQLKLPALTAEQKNRLNDIKPALAGRTLKPCG